MSNINNSCPKFKFVKIDFVVNSLCLNTKAHLKNKIAKAKRLFHRPQMEWLPINQ